METTVIARCLASLARAASWVGRNTLRLRRFVLFALLDLTGLPTGKPDSGSSDYQMYEPYPDQANVSPPPERTGGETRQAADRKHPTVS